MNIQRMNEDHTQVTYSLALLFGLFGSLRSSIVATKHIFNVHASYRYVTIQFKYLLHLHPATI